MINLLFVINFLENGGPSRVVENLSLALDSKKYKITVLTIIDENNSEVIRRFKKHGVKIVELKYQKSLKQVLSDKQKIIEAINSINADIIHTHGVVPTFLVADKKIYAKKITTIHNIMQEDYRYTYGKIKGALIARVHINKLKNFDKIICCSRSSFSSIKKYFSDEKIGFIYNGVDMKLSRKRDYIRNKYGIRKSDILYVYVGSISKRKRSIELAKLFNKNHSRNEFLLLVGDGDESSKLNAIRDNNIIFIGHQDSVMDYFAAGDIFVSNSASEGLPIAVIEALGNGMPCLLSDIPSHKEFFTIDKNAYIGEIFSESVFSRKKQLLEKNFTRIQPEKIRNLQNKFLSNSRMSGLYEEKYLDMIG